MSGNEDPLDGLNRQIELQECISKGINKFVKENGKLTDDDVAYIVEQYARYLTDGKAMKTAFKIMQDRVNK